MTVLFFQVVCSITYKPSFTILGHLPPSIHKCWVASHHIFFRSLYYFFLQSALILIFHICYDFLRLTSWFLQLMCKSENEVLLKYIHYIPHYWLLHNLIIINKYDMFLFSVYCYVKYNNKCCVNILTSVEIYGERWRTFHV